MKRQKRDKTERIYLKGFNAAISGKPKDSCPYQQNDYKAIWFNGYREGVSSKNDGYFS